LPTKYYPAEQNKTRSWYEWYQAHVTPTEIYKCCSFSASRSMEAWQPRRLVENW